MSKSGNPQKFHEEIMIPSQNQGIPQKSHKEIMMS